MRFQINIIKLYEANRVTLSFEWVVRVQTMKIVIDALGLDILHNMCFASIKQRWKIINERKLYISEHIYMCIYFLYHCYYCLC